MEGLDFLTPVGTLAGIVVAGYLAFKAERSSRRAEVAQKQAHADSEAAAEIARAEQARVDYIEILEREINIVKNALDNALKRITVLEVSEENCQKERVSLLAENSSLRRQLDKKLGEP